MSSGNATSSNLTRISLSRNTATYFYVHFDLSSIPVGAEIQAVNCKFKFRLGYQFTNPTATLCSGDVAKSSSIDVSNFSSITLYELSGGTWTRDEILACRIKFYLYISSTTSSYRHADFFGADLTVTYTYQSEKFMLKLGGAWHDIARVFKKVSGIWVEQTDLANVIEDGVRYKNGGEIASVLPSGYTRLDYIESSGSQYINTGYKATSENYRIKCKFATTNDETSTVLFGGGASTDIVSALLQSTNQVKFYVGSGSVSGATATFVRGAECELECHANTGTFTVNLDGVAYSGSYSGAINKEYPLFIFANNVSGTASQFSSIRLYAFQIYDNGNMVRNLIPCTNANSVAGMYDTVNDVFYQSASGTAFDPPEPNNIITFTIAGTIYQAQEGMTWAEWVASGYNTAGYKIASGLVFTAGGGGTVRLNGTNVSSVDIISSGGTYTY